MRTPGSARRGGFTLVELLVAVGLIILLSALAAGVAYSGILDSHKLTSSSDKISGWLLQARAKATRDQAPRGLRLIVNGNAITELQPIETPEPLTPNPNGDPNGFKVALLYRQPAAGPLVKELHITHGSNNAATLTALLNELTAGDVLSLPELGTLHRLTGPPVGAVVNTLQRLQNPALPYNATSNPYLPVPSLQLTVAGSPSNLADPTMLPALGGLANPFPATPAGAAFVPNYTTTLFGFQRVARPTLGEQPLRVTNGIVIDRTISQLPPPDPTTGNYDILFAQNGEVLNAGSAGRVILWVRNPGYNNGANPTVTGANAHDRAGYESAGEMALITVYSKTGAIVTHPVAVPQTAAGTANPGHDPYAFTKDGINSGL
jgi:hypothetical protein